MEKRERQPGRLQTHPERRLDGRAPFQRGADAVPAWEEIETGRFRPRRIRGSFPGRELG